MGRAAEQQPSLAELAGRALEFAATGDGERPYTAVAGGVTLVIQVNDFPAEPLYTVLADGQPLGDLEDWPEPWLRPGLPAALRELAARSPRGAALLAVAEPLGPVALHLWARVLCTAAAPDARGALRALGFGGALTGRAGSWRLDPPPAQTAETVVDERDGRLATLRFTPGPQPVTRGALDAELGPGGEPPRVHWDSPYTVIYRTAVPGAPFSCDVFAYFRDAPAPATAATYLTLRRQPNT
jgi:hypothetical protein